jgi:hypothetical protein
MNRPEFTIEVSQNEYLPAGTGEVNAIVNVTSTSSVADGRSAMQDDTAAAEVIIIDCSGSMKAPGPKMVRAREATAAAIDAIRDGVAFAVVAGTHVATQVYPSDGLISAGPAARQEAKFALRRLHPDGGTAIGRWLLLARELLVKREDALRHAILLTDGRNEHESAEDLAAAVERCEGVFSCDCRGVGTDWVVDELRTIATALLGTVDIVPDPAGLAADFEAMMTASMAKEVGDVTLRVWTPEGAIVRFVKQVWPAVEDLTARRTQAAPQAGDYPAGAWGTESRDYHVCVTVRPAAVGDEMLAARISMIHTTAEGPQTLAQGKILAKWTDDEAESTRINRHVAHYTGQAEIAQAIYDGIEARKAGDDDTAAAEFGRAVALAYASGNQDTSSLLANVVDVIDASTGTVRLKPKVSDADEMLLDTRSTRTVRVKK